MRTMKHQEIHTGFIVLRILHHAVEGEFFGNWMIEELTDSRLSPDRVASLLYA
jgi:PadR family transcriptional regulator PadR